MKALYDSVSAECSRIITGRYSTSFSLGIKFLSKKFHKPIYGIYGFVRLADEIVDSFHGYDKENLLSRFRSDTRDAIQNRISLNPVLNCFQHVVHQYGIGENLIDTFLYSMEMDLSRHTYDRTGYDQYILGSAESVGLMCLRVFCEGKTDLYDTLKYPAMKLGAAFQKVNFLRDLKADNDQLGRMYFPGLDLAHFTRDDKLAIEKEIEADFREALAGILKLPRSSRSGVYLAYCYYSLLFRKIKQLPHHRILSERVRIPDYQKLLVLMQSGLRLRFHLP